MATIRYKNVSKQAIQVMTVQNRKRELILVPSDQEFTSERETAHIKNMLAAKMVKRISDQQ